MISDKPGESISLDAIIAVMKGENRRLCVVCRQPAYALCGNRGFCAVHLPDAPFAAFESAEEEGHEYPTVKPGDTVIIAVTDFDGKVHRTEHRIVEEGAKEVTENAAGQWRLVPAESNRCAATFRYYSGGAEYDEQGKVTRELADYEAFCKSDGCIDLHRFYNGDDSGAEENTDSIHICDLAEFISELQALQRTIATRHQGFRSKSELGGA